MTEERYKELMAQVGMPQSQSLLRALQQAVMEATLEERERCARIAENPATVLMTDGAKTYLGDGVYAYCDDYHIVLTTENGVMASNTIYLDPHVLKALHDYIEKLKTEESQP